MTWHEEIKTNGLWFALVVILGMTCYGETVYNAYLRHRNDDLVNQVVDLQSMVMECKNFIDWNTGVIKQLTSRASTQR